jgi:Cu2+-containing amine oxidase
LFVPCFQPTQIYAGGEYAFQSTGKDTLQTWTDEDRSIANTDIVAYYTVGFKHVPRMEDWPVMSTKWASFQLRPFNFFTYNPAITIAPPVTKQVETPPNNADTSAAMLVSQSSFVVIVLALCSVLL